MNIPEPHDAATVILVRENEAGPFEVFLMRRHQEQTFMGSAFVYPGGRVDKADRDPELAVFSRGLSAEEAGPALNEPDLAEETALGLFFAAVRETFEESGVLLAVPARGGRIDFSGPGAAVRFARYRRDLHEQKVTLLELAQKEDVLYALDRLTPYAHWITPPIESKRFDTRFLLARMPRGQSPVHDSIEMTESLWITPAEALERQAAGRLLLMPPTFKTMLELAAYSSADQLFAAAASRRVQTIQPDPFKQGDSFGLKLPHDPEYTIAAYKQPPRPEEPSRIVMTENGWRAVWAES